MRCLSRVSVMISFSFLLSSYSEANTIALNQSITDGQTLVSPGQRFELGFFSPGRSKNRYLGILYKATPDAVVWVANREIPLTDSRGVFTISINGTPVIFNSINGIIIWSSNVSRVPATPLVKLLDSGNLVLIDQESSDSSDYLWQSFDYPGDTRLPGMLMGENSRTGMEQYLTSWRSADDPSPGDFIFRIENLGFAQMVVNEGTRKIYRTGPWNGIQFNGLPLPTTEKPVESSIKVFDEEKLISITDPYNSSVITRLTLNQSGYIQRYILDEKKNKWNLLYTLPNIECNHYQKCGSNSVCNSETMPACQCLKGYAPRNQKEWELLDWSSGCVRVEPPNCKNGEGFENIAMAKLPDMLQIRLKKNLSLSECEAECLKNCSCAAYTNPFITQRNNDCLMWYGDLVDLVKFADGYSVQNVYIRAPSSELESTSGLNMKKKKQQTLKVVLIPTATGLFLLGLVYWCIVLKVKRKEPRRNEEDLELPLFDLSTVMAATTSFAKHNLIGRGGFGPVYKGRLSTGQEIAVKRLSKDSGQGAEEFKNEVVLIAKLQHRNLVRLLGCCIQGGERMLIYEYMQNQSLDHLIFDSHRTGLLTWPKRLDIILGIARGLLYLHQDSRLKIIHRDLKPGNILLDRYLEPKISDFGLARIFGGDDHSFVKTKRVIGTYGYMAPEYAVDGKFSDKSDVFSMGVVLLEIVSGKRNRNFTHPDHNHNLLGHAWLLWNENKSLELMDACLKEDSFSEVSQVERCIQVGLLCVQKSVEDRPAMSSVVFMLGNEGSVMPRPKEPGFFIERRSEDVQASGRRVFNTNGMVTITQLQPR